MWIRSFAIFWIHKFSIILHYIYIDFVILLYNNFNYSNYINVVISFVQYKGHIIWQFLLSTFSDVLRTFSCPSTIGNLWSVILGTSILRPVLWAGFNGNISILKALGTNSLPWKRTFLLSEVSFFLFICFGSWSSSIILKYLLINSFVFY